jgi:uncharacterized damage-inducible protein DinB
MTDPLRTAAHDTVRRTLGDMRACIAGFPKEALNWKPAGEDSNSVAVLTVHSLHSTRSWLSIATGEPLPERDRASEFRVEAEDNVGLFGVFDEMASDCLALLEPSQSVDWATIRRTHSRPNPEDDTKVPAAWALLHAIEHLREHLGQLQLTRQLWDMERARAL